MLNANHITVRFGGLVAVSDVSLAIQKGTIHSVIGPTELGNLRCSMPYQECTSLQ